MSHVTGVDRSSRRWRWLAWIGAVALVSSCTNSPEGLGNGDGRPTTRALISAPTTGSAADAAVVGPARIYVSMAPGTEPRGDSVTIVRLGGGAATGSRMTDGGFDPIALEADVGDTLAIGVHYENGDSSTTYGVVPVKGRPVMVRTSPPDGRTDVPLNCVIQVVFSEPMDSASLPTALHLQVNGVDVPGTVTGTSVGGDILVGELVPSSPLDSGTSYEISVSTEARDRAGTPMANAIQSHFTTAGTSAGPPPDPPISSIQIWQAPTTIGVGETAVLQAWGNGGGFGRIRSNGPILWSSSDESIASVAASDGNGVQGVDYFAHLRGVVQGTATITAAADGVSAHITVAVGAPAASMAIPTPPAINASACGAAQLTAVLRDGAGNLLVGRRPLWSSDSPTAYVDATGGVVFGIDSGTATITATTGLISGSTTVSVVGHMPFDSHHMSRCD